MVDACDSKSHIVRCEGSSPSSGTMKKPKVIAIVGPTASGKTSLSIKIAQQINGEIISADSRQVYRGLDIGTGKVTLAEAQGVPHHLIDVANIDTAYTVTDFTYDTDLAINRIYKREHVPIIAGGTFFYLDQVRRKNIAPSVPPNKELREKLEAESLETLFEKLTNADPERALAIDKKNKRRLVRALEVIDALGKVPPVQKGESPYEWLVIGITVEKEQLRRKFKERLLGWMEAGLLEEVALIQNKVTPLRFNELGFEYTLTRDFIEGKFDQETYIQKFVEKNWQYAKRQMTWLKRDHEIEWFKATDNERIAVRVTEFLAE